MNKLVHAAAVAVTVIGMEFAGLSIAGSALADPDQDPVPDQLCPFRNVIDRMGGNDQCDPGWNDDNNVGAGAPNPCAPGGGWAGNNELCPPPTLNVNINHDGNGNHQVTVNGQPVDPKNITVDGKPTD